MDKPVSSDPRHVMEKAISLNPVHLMDTPVPLSQGLIFLLLCVFVSTVLPRRKQQRILPGIPIVGVDGRISVARARKRFIHNSKSMLLEGYQKYKGGFFYVPSPLGERLMIPTRYLEELKSAPMDKLDFVATFQEMFEGKYTGFGSRAPLHPRVIKAQLNHHLADVMPPVDEEVKDAFADLFPPAEDWTEIAPSDLFTKIVARASSRLFGGTTLSRDEEWLDTMHEFAMDGFAAAQKLKKFSDFVKPIAQYFIPEMNKLHRHYATAKRLLVPLLTDSEREKAKPMDFLQMMWDNATVDEKRAPFVSVIQLKVSFAAIHTSAAGPTQLLYDLCTMPEYVQPLREEIEETLAEEGSLTKKAFVRLSKLDSILKESQRFNPLLLLTFERLVTADYKLSDGFVIPAGTTIGVPSQAIAMDPELYPEPEKFDGFRFDRLRLSDPKSAGRQGYASSMPASMAFGYGRHACPGRFFAANEIKAIMVHLLMNYDFKFPEGQTRPESLTFETQYLPHPTAKVLIKRRAI